MIESGDLELLMRNKALQARYDTWMVGMKVKYGSTGEWVLLSATLVLDVLSLLNNSVTVEQFDLEKQIGPQ